MNLQSLYFKSSILLLSGLLSTATFAANLPKETSEQSTASVFATIGKGIITWQDYKAAFEKASKNKFYHAQPSNDVIAELQREVSNTLVTNQLILNEANKRKLKPDTAFVTQEVKKFEAGVAGDPNWTQSRDRVLPIITKRIQNENLVQKMESIIRKIPAPSEVEIKEYYTAHPEKFTTPAEQKISIILIKVDPSSTPAEWNQAIEDGKSLVKRIRDGENFEEMAKRYSQDEATVDQGGDMGYLHEGMLPGMPQLTVDRLQVGDVSEPLRLLEGVAIFKLTQRNPAILSSLNSVKQRATELLYSEKSDSTWLAFIADLKSKAAMNIDESHFLPLPVTSTTSAK